MTNRAVRGLQLLDEAGTMSAADFRAVKWDKAYARESRAFRYVDEIQSMNLPPAVRPPPDRNCWPDGRARLLRMTGRRFGRLPAIGGMAG